MYKIPLSSPSNNKSVLANNSSSNNNNNNGNTTKNNKILPNNNAIIHNKNNTNTNNNNNVLINPPNSSTPFHIGCIYYLDNLLSYISSNIDNSHSLSDIAYESSMLTREIVSCWPNNSLSSIASESISNRLTIIGNIVKRQIDRLSYKILEDSVGFNLANKNNSIKNRSIAVKLDLLYVFKPNAPRPQYIFSLNNLYSVNQLHNARDPDIQLIFRQQNNSNYTIDTKKIHELCVILRFHNDRVRQQWFCNNTPDILYSICIYVTNTSL